MKELWFCFGRLAFTPPINTTGIQTTESGGVSDLSISNGCSIEDMNRWAVFSDTTGCGSQTFTLLFSEVIMALLPLCIALIATAIRLTYIRTASQKARREWLWIFKMAGKNPFTHFVRGITFDWYISYRLPGLSWQQFKWRCCVLLLCLAPRKQESQCR